jgi:hypothetical protein
MEEFLRFFIYYGMGVIQLASKDAGPLINMYSS